MGEAKKTISRWQNILEYSILLASLIISALIILKGDGFVPKPPMDQHFVDTVNLQLRQEAGHFVFQYPNLMHAGGITSSLTAGLFKLIIPTTSATLNWSFKIFAMAGHLITSFYLLRTVIPNLFSLRLLGFLIIATSGFQLLEPSSEVVSASFLNLFFIAALRPWPKVVPAFFLASFGLCKVELSLSAIALSLLWWAWEWRRGTPKSFQSAVFTWLFMAMFLAPAFVLTGSNPFTADRGSTAFFSTYKDTMRMHQFQLVPPTEAEADVAMRKTVFRDSPTFKDVIIKHPNLYADYLGVSAARSIPNIFKVFKFMLIPFIIALSRLKYVKENTFILQSSILVAACILIPSWLFIFVRMRYIAKILPLVTAATISSSIELSEQRKSHLATLWVSGLATLAWQLFSLTPYQD